jgi:zinc transport system substrate-binding protein
MKRALSLLLCLTALLSTGVLQGSEKMPLCAGLGPVAHILREVGGSHVTVSSMLPEGRSPHDYAPGTRELRLAMGAKLFFTTNMLYEQRIVRALKGKVAVVDISEKIRRIPLDAGKHDHHHCGLDHHSCGGGGSSGDPHVWLSPVNCAVMAEKAAEELAKAAPEYKTEFRRNAERFSQRMRRLHETLLKRLAPCKGMSFFVYHPAFGYFAELYGLRQKAIELGGREASPARMAAVIREARKAGVKVVFVQKQFNPASAKALANAIKGEVMELDPLAPDVEQNFNAIAAALLKGFGKK